MSRQQNINCGTAVEAVMIYTIGYGNRNWEIFLELLQQNGISTLADIRTLPFSRFNPAFRRDALEKGLQEAGIRYMFMGDALGGRPKDAALYMNGIVSDDLVEASPVYKKGISELLQLDAGSGNTCILCSELKPEHCHRKNLVGRTLERMGVAVMHIDEKGNLRRQDAGYEGRLF